MIEELILTQNYLQSSPFFGNDNKLNQLIQENKFRINFHEGCLVKFKFKFILSSLHNFDLFNFHLCGST